jgi:hypothetical protein
LEKIDPKYLAFRPSQESLRSAEARAGA